MFKLDRHALETIYFAFIQCSIMYASVVWAGTFESDIAKLEKIQVDGMRLITGAMSRSNINGIYIETGYPTFKERLTQNVSIMIYKIVHGIAPAYLQSLIRAGTSGSRYNLRNKPALKVPFARLETYKKSFFPFSSDLWNRLREELILAPSVKLFKIRLKGKNETNILYFYGQRWPSVHHARMRIGCSKLNSDLFYNLHVVNSPSCSCGHEVENSEHFLFYCSLFEDQRTIMMNQLHFIIPSIENLLYGDNTLSQK